MECDICGNQKFIKEDGFYICAVCGVQSQSIRDVSMDFADGNEI
jgi:hypothetical protein